MVGEIIQRAGLLSDVGEHDGNRRLYVFAHRSIQELLTAEELRRPGRDGDALLLRRAADLTWRQAILFYTAGQEAEAVDGFLRALSGRDADLAAYCLQGAKPSDSAAASVLDALRPVTGAGLGALAAATRSPRLPVQRMAIDQLKAFIADSVDAFSAAGATIEAMLPLLQSLAVTNASEIAALVPQVIRNLPDDQRLVGPLWQSLRADGIELHKKACAEIVQRLLTLTMEPDSFAELARQEQDDPYFLTELRSHAYPFKKGLGIDHNQVTLLAWAEYLDVTPAQPNRFFEARSARHLARIETARRRTVSFSLCLSARVASGLIFAAAWVTAAVVLAVKPGLLMNPFGWKTLLLVFGAGYIGSLFVTLAISMISEAIPNSSPVKRYLGGLQVSENDFIGLGTGNFLSLIPEEIRVNTSTPETQMGIDQALQLLMAVTVPIATAPLLKISVAEYLVFAIGGFQLYALFNLNAFAKGVRYYLYRPSEFVDMYDDPRSMHWLGIASPRLQLGDEGARVARPAQVS
jgi:hypothetical protein